MKKLMVALGAALVLALPSLATTRTWVGGDSGSVTNKYCWDPAANPSQNKTDVWVFTNSAVVSTLDPNYNIYFAKIRLEAEGINVYFKGDGRTMGIAYSSCKTGELFVAAGSTLCFSNRFGCYQGSAVRKTGAGTVRFADRCGYSSASGNWPCRPFIAEEGRTLLWPTGKDGSFGFYGDLLVRDGAVVDVSTYSVIAGNANDVTIEKGGTLIHRSSMSMDTLNGSGRMVQSNTTESVTVRMKADCGFAGTIEKTRLALSADGGHVFTVGASNTLADLGTTLTDDGGLLKFAPGIGEFWIKYFKGRLATEDAAGEPIRLHVGFASEANAKASSFTGPGDLLVGRSAVTLTNGQVAVSGDLAMETANTLTFGTGTAGQDFDFSGVGGRIVAKNALVFASADTAAVPQAVEVGGELTISGPTVFSNAFHQADSKTMTVSAPVTFSDLEKRGGYTYLNADLTMESGTWTFTELLCQKSATLTLTGGLIYGGKSADYMNYWDTMFKRPRRYGAYFVCSADGCKLDIAGGSCMLGNNTGAYKAGDIAVRDGGVLTILRGPDPSGCETDGYHLDFDGGTLRMPSSRNPYAWDPFSTSWRSRIGAKGAVIECMQEKMYHDSQPLMNWYVESTAADGVEADGGITFRTAGNFLLHKPQNLTGPVAILDGRFTVQPGAFTKADGSATEAPLGTGDLTLGTTYLNANGNTSETPLRLASGEGSKLSYVGAAVLSMRYDTGNVPQSIAIGDPASAEPTLVRGGKGSCLYLRDPAASTTLDGEHGRITASGGVAMDGKGRVKDPIFAFTRRGDMGNGAVHRLDFTTYDAEKGFVAFDGYTAGLDGGKDSVALVDYNEDGAVTIPGGETKEVAALSIFGDRNGTHPTNLSIAKDASLKVGNGTDPACILVNSRHESGTVVIGGEGALDFGSSEGVIASNVQGTYGYPSTINARISGSGGVSFLGPFGIVYPYIRIGGDNDYTGGTWIRGIKVEVTSPTAFGRDTVTVGPGQNAGGTVWFASAMTMANDFVVSGHGMRWYNYTCDGGALWFQAPVTLTGDVRVEDYVRLGSYQASKACVGTFQGVVSGGSIQLMQSVAPVVFEGANTYTGGTEVVSSTLILRGPCSAGTGEVALDNGVLRFENTTPVVFTNDLDGIGTIELAGTAPVTFACKGLEKLPDALRTLNPGSTIDFPACTNCTVALGADGLDLGGAAVKVGSLRGSGRVENGVLMVAGEIQPGGEGAVGTLTFAPGVLTAAGATFVCEVGDEGMDKLVVENAFDLAALKLRTVRLGYCQGVEKILSAEALTGEFAETVFARKSHEVSYGDTAATLSVGKGTTLIVR